MSIQVLKRKRHKTEACFAYKHCLLPAIDESTAFIHVVSFTTIFVWVKYLFRLFICPNFGRPSHFQQTSPLRESTLHKRRQVASAQLKYKQRPLYPTLRTNPFLKVPDPADFTYLFWFIDQRLGTNNTCTAPIPTWKNMPMMAIIASLPPVSSALSFSARSEAVKTLNPKSPPAARVPGDWSWKTSQKAMYAKI